MTNNNEANNEPNEPNEEQDTTLEELDNSEVDNADLSSHKVGVSEEELMSYFQTQQSAEGDNEDIILSILKHPDYSDEWPCSYAEAVEVVKKHKGKELKDIPLNERICTAFLLVQVRSEQSSSPTRQSALGYDAGASRGNANSPRLTILGTSHEWGGVFVAGPDAEGTTQHVRLYDEEPLLLSLVVNVSPEAIHYLRQELQRRNTQTIGFGVVADCRASYSELEMVQQKRQGINLKALAQDQSVEIDNEAMDGGNKSESITLARVFIDPSTIVEALPPSELPTMNGKELTQRLSRNAVAGRNAGRAARIAQLSTQAATSIPTTTVLPEDQADALEYEEVSID